MMQTPILAGAGLPRHWMMGTGEDANRASAYEMGEPPIRAMNTRQLFVVRMIYKVFRYQIDEAVGKGMLKGVPDDELYAYSMDVPPVSRRDMAKSTTALETTVRTVIPAIDAGIVSLETAREQYVFVAGQSGFEIDLDEEIKRLAAEALAQATRDVGIPPELDTSDAEPAEREPAEETA